MTHYCGAHAEAARRRLRVETCTRTRLLGFAPRYAQPREALGTELSFSQESFYK